MSPAPGGLEAAYELGPELGRGAFGRVLSGKSLSTRQAVAIKLPLARPDHDQLARIEREAKLLAGLAHPRLVRFHGLYLDRSGLPALVYDLAPGKTLEARLAGGRPQDPAAVQALVTGIAEGLEALHRAGLVHRDLKPANVMEAPDGSVQLLDYGLARAVGEGQTLTRTGTIMGTPAYLAPEQLSGARPAPATDVYALGCMAFELLTGRLPFQGAPMEIVEAHLRAPPPRASELAPALSKAVDRALAKALEKEPDARHASAGAFAAELAQALGPSRAYATMALDRAARTRALPHTMEAAPPRPPPLPPAPRRSLPPLAALSAAAALLLAALLLRPPPSGGPAGPGPAPAEAEPATPADLDAFLDRLLGAAAVQHFFTLPPNTPIPAAYEARDAARRAFEALAAKQDLPDLLARLRATPVDGPFSLAVARLYRLVWPLVLAKSLTADPDPVHKEPPLLGGKLVPTLDALAARLLRFRREPAISFLSGLNETQVNEYLMDEPLKRRLHDEVPRRLYSDADPLALGSLGRAGAGWEVLHGHSLEASGLTFFLRIKAQGPTGTQVVVVNDPVDTGLMNNMEIPTLLDRPFTRPPEGDVHLALSAYNLNQVLATFVVSISFRDQDGHKLGEVAYPFPGPVADGREALLPGGEASSKRDGLLLRIRREVVPEATRRLGLEVFTVQSTGTAHEFLGLQQLLARRDGPPPADLGGAFDDGAASPFLGQDLEAVPALWNRVARAPAILAALGLMGATATDRDLQRWEDARDAFARLATDLRKSLSALPASPTPPLLADLSWLRLVSHVLTVRKRGKAEPYLDGALDAALDQALSRAVRIERLPGPGWPLGDGEREAERQLLAAQAAAGRGLAALRSFATYSKDASVWAKLRLSTPFGHPADSVYLSTWSGADMSDDLRRVQTELERVPSSLPVALAPFKGDLVLVLALSDWEGEVPGLVLRMAIEGPTGSTEVCFVPKAADQAVVYRVRIRESALPETPRRIVLHGHGLRPIGDDSDTARVHGIYQQVEGDPGIKWE